MTSPPHSTTTKDGARYYTIDGHTLPSVTTILQTLNKPFLVPGARKAVAEEILNNLGQYVHDTLYKGIDATRMEACRRAKAKWADKADLGSRVHQACEELDLGTPSGWYGEDVGPYVEQYRQFLATHQPIPQHVEVVGANLTDGYAGCIDRIYLFTEQNQLVLADLKTSSMLNAEYALQLAAYTRFEFLLIGDERVPMPQVDLAGIVHLAADRWAWVQMPIGDQVYDSFRTVRGAWNWSEHVSKQVEKEMTV